MSNHLICGSSRKLWSRVTLAGVVGIAVTLAFPPVIGQVCRRGISARLAHGVGGRGDRLRSGGAAVADVGHHVCAVDL